MKKTLSERIRALFSSSTPSDETFDELEDALIEGDVGVRLATDIVEQMRNEKQPPGGTREDIIEALKKRLRPYARQVEITPAQAPDALTFILVLGVNGVGKTTTIAKLVHHFAESIGRDRILLCAGDTFRAAAVEQLAIHAERLGVRIVKQERGADPGAVIYDAIESGKSRGARLLVADTAGRMHNKADLVAELSKIDRIVRSKIDESVYHRMLVVDATTGQNGLRQAEVFHEAIGIDSIFLAKCDSSGKGGIALAISQQLEIPVSFIGTGEAYDAIERFVPETYLAGLIG